MKEATPQLITAFPFEEQLHKLIDLLSLNPPAFHQKWHIIDTFANFYEPKAKFKVYKKKHESILVRKDLIALLVNKTRQEREPSRLSTLLKLIRIFSRLSEFF